MLEILHRPSAGVACSAGRSGEALSVEIAALRAAECTATVREWELLPLLRAAGRVCAFSVHSGIDLPPFANSAMDGYALAAAGLSGTGPWHMRVVGRAVAGSTRVPALETGCAMRIMTGAPLPEGADTVVMQEKCERNGDRLIVRDRPPTGKNVRYPGEDLTAGAVLVNHGELITPRHAAVLAAAGTASVAVYRKPRIALIATGNELAEPGAPLEAGQIYNANRYYLCARLERPWLETVDYGIRADDPHAIRGALRRAATECDIVLTTGGVSAGEEDHLLDVLKGEGAELDVLKVAMRPGKPVTAGRLGGASYFGLPGNPYACAITFRQIAWPAIRKCAGLDPSPPCHFEGVSDFTYSRRPGRSEFMPVDWAGRDNHGRPIVKRLGRGSSASLHPMVLAKAIAVLPPGQSEICPGDLLHLEPVDF